MKTPMQELRHEIEVWLDAADDNLVFAYKSVLDAIDESYLKKEKEVIINAYNHAYEEGWDYLSRQPEQYYNETFNNEE